MYKGPEYESLRITALLIERVEVNADQSVSSVTQSCPTLYDPMHCGTPGLPVHHQLPEFTKTHVHWLGDVIQKSHSLSSLLLPPSIIPIIRVFSKESVLRIRSCTSKCWFMIHVLFKVIGKIWRECSKVMLDIGLTILFYFVL